MARPKKDPAERRSERLEIRLTQAELIHIETEAAKAGLSPTEFQRRRSLGYQVSPTPLRSNAALISELNRVGVNLNQIARSLNSDRRVFGVNPQEVFDELSRVLEKVAYSHDH